MPKLLDFEALRSLGAWTVAEGTGRLLRGPIHANELSVQADQVFECVVDSRHLAGDVFIDGANDDAAMTWIQPMQANEIHSIERDDGASVLHCEVEHLFIRDTFAGPTRFLNRQNVMSKLPQLLDDWNRKNSRWNRAEPSLVLFIFTNLLLDGFAVPIDVGPGLHQIDGFERRIAAEDICFGNA